MFSEVDKRDEPIMLQIPVAANLKRNVKLKSAFVSLSKFITRAFCVVWVTALNFRVLFFINLMSDGKIR